MAGKVVNSSFVLLRKFGAGRQFSASKSATSHIRKTLSVILLETMQPLSRQDKNEQDNYKNLQYERNNLPKL